MDCAWLHSCMDNSWLKFVTTRGLEVSIHPPKYFQKSESLANVGTEPSLQPLSWK